MIHFSPFRLVCQFCGFILKAATDKSFLCVSHLDHEVILLVHLAHTPHHLTLLRLRANRPGGRVLSTLCCQR